MVRSKYSGAKDIQKLVDRKIISVHGTSFPLFDNISTDIVRAVINNKTIDFGKTDKEIIRHAGIHFLIKEICML